MDKTRVQAPQGIKELMQELWQKHKSGDKSRTERIFWVDLPEPTEEEKRIMAADGVHYRPIDLDENALQSLLDKASEKLGGW